VLSKTYYGSSSFSWSEGATRDDARERFDDCR